MSAPAATFDTVVGPVPLPSVTERGLGTPAAMSYFTAAPSSAERALPTLP